MRQTACLPCEPLPASLLDLQGTGQRQSYTTTEVARITGLTLRQLQWRDETGVIQPGQIDGRRVWSERELFAVALMRDLSERGFSPRKVKTIWAQAQKQGLILPDASKRWMLTNGERVVFLAHSDVVLAFLAERRQPVYVLVPLADLYTRLQADVERLTTPRKRQPQRAFSMQPGESIGSRFPFAREQRRA